MIFPIKTRAIFLACLILTPPASAAGDFARSMTPAEIQAAGLAKLTPGELARLEEFARRFKAGEDAPARSTPEAAAKKSGKLMPEWVGALLTLEKAGAKPEKSDALESRLAGNFSGWTGRSTFRLENGQLWAQSNGDSYEYAPTLKRPKVKIYPASFGSYWLEVEGVHGRCRIRPVRLQ